MTEKRTLYMADTTVLASREAELLTALRAGESDAYEQLVRTFTPFIDQWRT